MILLMPFSLASNSANIDTSNNLNSKNLPYSVDLDSGTISFQYDANGNMIKDHKFYYSYDEFGQLVEIRKTNSTGQILVQYIYDETGQRIKKTSYTNGLPEITYYIGDNFVSTIQNETTINETYAFANGNLVAKNVNGEIFYIYNDFLGGVNVITDSSGNVVERMSYEPYGMPDNEATSRYLFTGQEYDPESGLYYYGARYYNPFIARFIQPDTIIQNPYDYESLNRYSYARNNPVKYKDDTGHFWHIIGGAIIGGVVSAGFNMISQIWHGADLFGSNMNWNSVGQSFLEGATIGAVSSATFGVGAAAFGATQMSKSAASITSMVIAGRAGMATQNIMSGDSISSGMLSPVGIGLDTAFGLIGATSLRSSVSSLKSGVATSIKQDIVGSKYNLIKPSQSEIRSSIVDEYVLKILNKKPIDNIQIISNEEYGKFIDDGHHRFVAYKKLGYTNSEIPMDITYDNDPMRIGKRDWSKTKYVEEFTNMVK